MKKILEKNCKFSYAMNENSTFVYQYKWLEFFFFSKTNVTSMGFSDDNHSNYDMFIFTSSEKLEMFFLSFK
jgi:hypothetical protein